jgi:hypothetical protein
MLSLHEELTLSIVGNIDHYCRLFEYFIFENSEAFYVSVGLCRPPLHPQYFIFYASDFFPQNLR